MKCKVVSDGTRYKVLVKVLFWWIDPGFPAYNSYKKAKAVADEYTDVSYKDCKPKDKRN